MCIDVYELRKVSLGHADYSITESVTTIEPVVKLTLRFTLERSANQQNYHNESSTVVLKDNISYPS